MKKKKILVAFVIILIGLVLASTWIIYLKHVRANILISEDIREDDFIVNLKYATDAQVMVTVDYPNNIAIYNSPDFIHLVNLQNGEEIPSSPPYYQKNENTFFFTFPEDASKDDYELVINKIIADVDEKGELIFPDSRAVENNKTKLSQKIKYGTINIENIENSQENNKSVITAKGNFISTQKNLKLHGISGKDSIIFVTIENDDNINIINFFDKSSEGQKQLTYDSIQYSISTDFHYKLK